MPPDSTRGLSAAALGVVRGGRVVFKGVGLAAGPGEALLLHGANGAGKSTLLRLLAGLLAPSAGAVSWDGAPLARDPGSHAARLRYLGHGDAVKGALSVRANLAFWADLEGGPRGAADRALERLGLDRLAGLPGHVLSAGQRRRLALARLALAPRPLWLLDEPTTALDAGGVGTLAALVAEHRAAGGILLAATHDDFSPSGARILFLGPA